MINKLDEAIKESMKYWDLPIREYISWRDEKYGKDTHPVEDIDFKEDGDGYYVAVKYLTYGVEDMLEYAEAYEEVNNTPYTYRKWLNDIDLERQYMDWKPFTEEDKEKYKNEIMEQKEFVDENKWRNRKEASKDGRFTGWNWARRECVGKTIG